ncbi:MAG: hypothetical protein IJH57_02520, partial [Mogibacterium sp.]|nr:hypothetical protein [Mogibacterium sp.]
EESPYVMGRDNPYMGFFGVLGKNAVVKDVNLTGVDIYATTPQYVYLGGIAAINDASSDTKKAMVIDGCSVKGKMTAVANKSNAMVGGIIAQQYRGAIINCMTDMDLKCTVKTGNAIAEVGGLVGLNNRGLVANSYTLGNVFGSASRNNGDEGMASTGNLVGVQAGDLVGCYSRGDNTTAEYSVYAGELAGWITGIGKVYSCYYNKEAKMSIDGRAVNPPADFGTKVAPGVNEEGDAYVGGIVDDLNAYTSSDYSGITDKLNSRFSEYPTDIEIYGITGAALKKWKYDSESETVTFGSERAEITYKQPQAEIVPPDVEELYDGTWYGRDDNKKVVVKISTVDGEVSGNPEVVSGDASDEEAYENAVSRARTKALYGDTTGYGEADTKLFGGGKGTKEEPYLISNEAQLRAIAESLNEDETFADVYFKQTADIDVSSAEWLPIGHAVMAKVKKAWTQVASYPFLGNYDGDSFTISGVTIGSLENPSSNPRVNFTAGLFGFVTGDHYSNAKIPNDVRISTLENIKLRDVDISVTSEGQNYTAGLVGNIQNGFLIDNCSVTGCVSSYSKDSFARGAGIAGNAIRGTVLNTWTDVDVYAQTDAGNVYAGGLYAIDNRTTSINCYSTSSITANAAANNKVHIGGLSGQAGGVHYNCYASGDVSSLKTTSDAGIVEGRLAGIAVDSKVYYKGNAKLKIAGTLQDTAAIGVSVPDNPDVVVKSASQMASKDFAGLLNQNADAASSDVESLQNIIDSQTDLTHVVQFSGKKEDLATWIIAEGRAVLLDKNLIKKADEEEARKKAEEEAAKAAEKEAHEAELKTAKEALAKAQKARAAAELKLAKRVKTVTVNAATVNATAINKAVKAAGGSSKYVTKIVLGKKVKRISKGAFKSYTKVKTLEIRSKKLKKNYVRGSLKNSKVTTIKVNVGKKKANMTYVNKYKKIFTKKNVGKKVKIKL